MQSCCSAIPGTISMGGQVYDHRLKDDIFYERFYGRVCLREAHSRSVAAQKNLHAKTINYRIIDFIDSEIDSIEQNSIDQMLSTKLLDAYSRKKIKLLLVVKDHDELLSHVIENIKSFTSKNLILFFSSRSEAIDYIKTDVTIQPPMRQRGSAVVIPLESK